MINAEIYQKEINCYNCLVGCHLMDKRSPECKKQIEDAFKQGVVEKSIQALEMAIDWGMKLTQRESRMIKGYYEISNKNISQN